VDNTQLEQEIKDKGLTAPRISLDHIKAKVVDEYYHQPKGTTLTLCVLTLQNGFTVSGESACASPDNFDIGLGRKLAHDNALNKIWQLEGYLLRERIYNGSL
jgi:hypothetical protein